MEKEELKITIEKIAKDFSENSKNKEILVISHFDTDGITSAAIMIKTLKELDKNFSLKIVKNLDEQIFTSLSANKLIIFLDLASGSLDYIQKYSLKDVYIIDHHEIIQNIPKEIKIINPQLNNKKEIISSSGLTYLFCKELVNNKNLIKLAVLGMVGDNLEKNIDKINNKILTDGEIIKKRGILLYPSTRPLNIVLEFNSSLYIPGVTGDSKGTLELLREAGIESNKGKFKSLIELDEKEMARLVTAIMLRFPKKNHDELIGDIFLIKMFNKLEDARELSATINACSRMDQPETALQLCLEIQDSKKKAETIYTKYKRAILMGLEFVSKTEKIEGNGFVIINAQNQIKETIIGTIASILSHSSLYEEGTIITTMAYYENKIKISARNVGNNGRNVREVLNKVISQTGGEIGGHKFAAGGIISLEKEIEFISELKRNLEIETIKI